MTLRKKGKQAQGSGKKQSEEERAQSQVFPIGCPQPLLFAFVPYKGREWRTQLPRRSVLFHPGAALHGAFGSRAGHWVTSAHSLSELLVGSQALASRTEAARSAEADDPGFPSIPPPGANSTPGLLPQRGTWGCRFLRDWSVPFWSTGQRARALSSTALRAVALGESAVSAVLCRASPPGRGGGIWAQ